MYEKPVSLSLLSLTGDNRAPAAPSPAEAAQASLAAQPAWDPEETVVFQSEGRLLILGADERATALADNLAGMLDITVLLPGAGVPLPGIRDYDAATGQIVSLTGHLGAFALSWEGCAASRQTLAGPTGPHAATFDLVLDLLPEPLLSWRQPPQGYFHLPPGAPEGVVLARLVHLVGEFEKPKYFSYRADKCAHSRAQISGCTQCIDVCSTRAIAPRGDGIAVDANLCMGCGACTTACPSGALSYQFPPLAPLGGRIRTALTAFAAAGGRAPRLVLHQGLEGRRLVADLLEHHPAARDALVPVEVHHVAAYGLPLWLSALAFGAAEVTVLMGPETDADYERLIRREARLAGVILDGLGYTGHAIHALRSGQEDLEDAWPAANPPDPAWPQATFELFDDKRTVLDLAVAHLYAHAPLRPDAVTLPPEAPFGQVLVNQDACTLCMACVGACPTAALASGGDAPQLRFAEHNCIQCGLCVKTCPEDALALDPRLLLTPEARRYRTLNETSPFYCTRCGNTIGTTLMVDLMIRKLTPHPMFSGPGALDRLKMCADCRVIDMVEKGQAPSIKAIKA